MPKKKLPWRTLAEFDLPTGRITREQADRAVLAVMAAQKAHASRTSRRSKAAAATNMHHPEAGATLPASTTVASS
jgi:hypothetical protein